MAYFTIANGVVSATKEHIPQYVTGSLGKVYKAELKEEPAVDRSNDSNNLEKLYPIEKIYNYLSKNQWAIATEVWEKVQSATIYCSHSALSTIAIGEHSFSPPPKSEVIEASDSSSSLEDGIVEIPDSQSLLKCKIKDGKLFVERQYDKAENKKREFNGEEFTQLHEKIQKSADEYLLEDAGTFHGYRNFSLSVMQFGKHIICYTNVISGSIGDEPVRVKGGYYGRMSDVVTGTLYLKNFLSNTKMTIVVKAMKNNKIFLSELQESNLDEELSAQRYKCVNFTPTFLHRMDRSELNLPFENIINFFDKVIDLKNNMTADGIIMVSISPEERKKMMKMDQYMNAKFEFKVY